MFAMAFGIQCRLFAMFCAMLLACTAHAAERINQEGRILGDLPAVTGPILFNTAEADSIVSAMQIFPTDNPWNEDVSKRPLLPNSDAMIAQVMADLLSTRRTLRPFNEMNFVIVPDNQPLVPIDFFNYADESDPSPYPIPSNMPVETWPLGTGTLTLSEWQQDINNDGGDRHSIIVMPRAGYIWETWLTRLVSGAWEASNGAKFNLNSNVLRPSGWTSGDAAGLAMFPALVRFDECERGMVEHAVRLVVKRTRVGPIYPATHQASVGNLTDPNIPAMGQRFRLKSSFNIPTLWTKHEKAVLLGLKKYGAIVADNGNFFSISVTPDNRFPTDAFSHLSSISITNFEVIQVSGAKEGPRSPGAPRVDAGLDKTVTVNSAVPLSGAILYTNTAPLRILWKLYSGPGTVIFSDTATTNTSATFSTAGTYTLMLSAEDGVHPPAYDAVKFSVVQSAINNIQIQASTSGTNLVLTWSGNSASYTVQWCAALPQSNWTDLTNVTAPQVQLPFSSSNAFFRVSAQP
jgi:hypothetical protein